jgi:hypothetical protein
MQLRPEEALLMEQVAHSKRPRTRASREEADAHGASPALFVWTTTWQAVMRTRCFAAIAFAGLAWRHISQLSSHQACLTQAQCAVLTPVVVHR